jgi:glycosyltransferase involved in cell wall biosynthesis
MRVAMPLSGLHRVVRGAEVAFESIAFELGSMEGVDLTLFGSGERRPSMPYEFVSVPTRDRKFFEKYPRIPPFRGEASYEQFSFLTGLRKVLRPSDYDVTIACSFPWVNLYLTRGRNRPPHIYVTQNGDHPAQSNMSEFKWFDCAGLVCTNPEYHARNNANWNCTLIPNGVDPDRFSPGEADRDEFDLPSDGPVALMVSALIDEKRVVDGIRAAARLPELHLVVCGDGPERDRVRSVGADAMPGRFHMRQLPREAMPRIYRCADLFLHMSLTEPSANAYIEALATGLPIVTHDREVTRWTLEKEAVLVDATDPAAVLAGIGTALGEDRSSRIRARRDLVERRFTWNRLAASYRDFLVDVSIVKPTSGIEQHDV